MRRHPVATLMVAGLLIAFVAAAGGHGSGAARTARAPRASHARRRITTHHRHHRHARSAFRAASSARNPACPPAARVLDGVYHPDRLQVLDPCQEVTGTIASARSEQDGDAHLDLTVDPAYRGMLDAGNLSEQHGALVVELMPRDHANLPEPHAGDRVTLWGAYVSDSQHGWHEVHPVWSETLDRRTYRSGPSAGGDPAAARSYDAVEECRTASGPRCHGYGFAASYAPRVSSTASSSRATSGAHCDPNYAGACLDPDASDYDCAGGSGNGPKYVQGPIRVVGTDHFRLDADGDGIACSG